jgi:hypothetical protein
MIAAALLLAGCEGRRLEEARARLGKAQAELKAAQERSEALSAEVEQWKQRQQKAESGLAQSRRNVELLQVKLADGWQGDVQKLGEQMNEAKVPESLRSWLMAAQQAKGSAVAERRFLQGLQSKDMKQVQAALIDWELRTGVTATPGEEEPEPSTCKLSEATFSCAPLPLGGPEDKVTQLCSQKEGERSWVLRSLHGRLVALPLLPFSRSSFKPVRVLSPRWWVLEVEEPEARRLVAFEVSESSATARQAISLTGGELAQVDLDADGEVELIGKGREVVSALSYSRKTQQVVEWDMPGVCPRLEKRTEKELEPMRAACTAWARARAPADAGAP